MKLLLDCTPLHSGGGIQVAIAFLDGLRHRDDIAWMAIMSEDMKSKLPDMHRGLDRIIALRKESAVDFIRLRRTLSRLEHQYRPDIVFTVFGPAYFRPQAPHLVGFALPNLIYPHDGVLASLDGPLQRIIDVLRCTLLRQADHLVVETETVRTRLIDRLGIEDRKVSVIGNCVNPLLLNFTPSDLPDRARFEILTPAAYYPHKNLEIIPAVAAALKRLDPAFDFIFRLTLDPASRPWRHIEAQARRFEVAGQVTTLGNLSLPALAKAYNAASAVFLPTLREASTAVYPESFYFGRPLITSDIDFARELCGDAAIFVPPMIPAVIAESILTMHRDPVRVAHLVEAGKKRLACAYPSSHDKFCAQIDLLQKVRTSGKTVPPI